jgi:hypothetical protein
MSNEATNPKRIDDTLENTDSMKMKLMMTMKKMTVLEETERHQNASAKAIQSKCERTSNRLEIAQCSIARMKMATMRNLMWKETTERQLNGTSENRLLQKQSRSQSLSQSDG